MKTKQTILAIFGTASLLLGSVYTGISMGWRRFGYDFKQHPDWHIMNPEDGGFGQLGAIVTYLGLGALIGFALGIILSTALWKWLNLRFRRECPLSE